MKTLKSYLVFFIVCLTASAALGQTTAFNYQGKLSDAGNPANGNYLLEFKLFDALAGGNQIGATISDVAVTATAGVFNTQLDFGASPFTGADRFLEIAVKKSAGDAYTVLNPRQQINSSPYSIRTLSAAQADVALDANKLGGVDASEYVTTTSVGNSFVKNTTTTQTGANFNIGGNGTVGGKLGVGMDPGNFKFSVNGAGQFRPRGNDESSIGFFSSVFGSPLVSLSTTDGSKAEMRLDAGALKLVTGFGFADPQDGITVARFGNVGVGTTTPSSRLAVQSPSGDYGITNTTGAITVGTYLGGSSSGATGGWFGTLSNDSLHFFTNSGQPNMTIAKTSGNVGIGTAAPSTRLSLLGGAAWTSAGWTGSLSMGNASALGWEANASGQRFGIGQSTGGLYFFRTNSAFGNTGSPAIYDMQITDTGNIMQARDKGGLVKAMVHINRAGGIVRCYNGITGSSTGNCGFAVARISTGIYRISFGFAVSDRFVSITPEYATTCNVVGSTCKNAGANFRFFGTDLEVFTFDANDSDNTSDAASMTIVY